MLGVWLVLSPFIFRRPADERELWMNDLLTGGIIAILSLLSFSRRLRHAHLATVAAAAWLLWLGYSAGASATLPAYQNYLVTGLLLLMLAILPNDINAPPEGSLGTDSQFM
jgi:hypothetical protein